MSAAAVCESLAWCWWLWCLLSCQLLLFVHTCKGAAASRNIIALAVTHLNQPPKSDQFAFTLPPSHVPYHKFTHSFIHTLLSKQPLTQLQLTHSPPMQFGTHSPSLSSHTTFMPSSNAAHCGPWRLTYTGIRVWSSSSRSISSSSGENFAMKTEDLPECRD